MTWDGRPAGRTLRTHLHYEWISPFAASARAANSTADTISFKCTAVSVHWMTIKLQWLYNGDHMWQTGMVNYCASMRWGLCSYFILFLYWERNESTVAEVIRKFSEESRKKWVNSKFRFVVQLRDYDSRIIKWAISVGYSKRLHWLNFLVESKTQTRQHSRRMW